MSDRKKNDAIHYKAHCLKRAEERYGIKLSNGDRKKLTLLIEKGDCNFLGKGAPHRKIYGVSYKGIRFKIVYDHYDRRIITFLPNGKSKND
jgi:hypothetical protein